MKTDQAAAHFGSKTALARLLDVSPQAVSQWGDIIPINHALRLEKMSGKKLKLRLDDYRD
jgi:transcriptional repressor of cell division inhibition gene dicB